jgi:cytochrome P450
MRAPEIAGDPAAILAAEVNEDPHSFFARLREAHPIARIADTGVHVVTRWSGIEQVLGRDADFSANLTGVLVRGPEGQPAAFELPATGATAVIATADEPDHAVHRRLSQPRLDARRIGALEPRLRAWTHGALDPWLAAGGGDFVPLAEGIPARALAHVLGLPDGDVARFRRWAMMGGDMLAGDATAPRLHELAAETGRMAAYLRGHLSAARAHPHAAPDAPLLAALAAGVESGTLPEEAAVGISIVMFGAGGESTAALIGSAVRWLAGDPDLADRLRTAPDHIPRFVEEIVRLEPPFKFHYRAVRRRCTLEGADLEPGDRLMLLWASANRDPRRIEDPGSLRLDRRHPRQHLGFGRGRHFCIGAPLARLEARVVVEELLAATRHLALHAADPPVYARSLFVRRLARLPVASS